MMEFFLSPTFWKTVLASTYGEHRIEDLALILHFLHAGSPVEDFGNDLILGRIAQFQP